MDKQVNTTPVEDLNSRRHGMTKHNIEVNNWDVFVVLEVEVQWHDSDNGPLGPEGVVSI